MTLAAAAAVASSSRPRTRRHGATTRGKYEVAKTPQQQYDRNQTGCFLLPRTGSGRFSSKDAIRNLISDRLLPSRFPTIILPNCLEYYIPRTSRVYHVVVSDGHGTTTRVHINNTFTDTCTHRRSPRTTGGDTHGERGLSGWRNALCIHSPLRK